MWLLKQIPKTLLDLAESPRPEELRLLHLLDPVDPQELPGLVVALLAARLPVELVDAPIPKVITESQNTHLLNKMQLARPVEVEDGIEGTRMPEI